MTKLFAHLDAQMTGRNPIDEPKTDQERRLSKDAVEGLIRSVGVSHVKLKTLRRALSPNSPYRERRG